MADKFTPRSPKPTRAQIAAVFKDPDMALKVERIFSDLTAAAEAANANADELEEVKLGSESAAALGAAAMAAVVKVAEISDFAESQATTIARLAARISRLERAISDFQEAPIR